MFTGVWHLFNIYPSLFTPLHSHTLILLHGTRSGTLAMRLSAISFGCPSELWSWSPSPCWIKLPTVWLACCIYHQVCKSIGFYHLCVWERSKSHHREKHIRCGRVEFIVPRWIVGRMLDTRLQQRPWEGGKEESIFSLCLPPTSLYPFLPFLYNATYLTLTICTVLKGLKGWFLTKLTDL